MKVSVASDSPQVRMLVGLYQSALSAVDPLRVLPPHLPTPPAGRTVVVGVGKAAAAMAQAVEAHWQGPLDGVVVVPEGACLPLRRIRVHESSHPVPDERSVAGAQRILSMVGGLTRDDLVIALISGGGSALCALPAAGLSLQEKQDITRQLLLRGASIGEINTVRRHLSAFKGGRLAAAAWPARVVTLAVSDIPGDELGLIASGPTLPDATTGADALDVLRRYGVHPSEAVRGGLARGGWESVVPGDPRLAHHEQRLVACAWDALRSAAEAAREAGWACHVLSDAMEGEARDLAKAHAGLVLGSLRHGQPFAAPCVLLSGGEATVTVRGAGRGGRNTEFVLALTMALRESAVPQRVHILSAGTDGLDGRSGAAGAWAAPDTLARASALGLNPRASLDDNDSASFFEALGGLLHTGPTHTNVNDFRAILIEPA